MTTTTNAEDRDGSGQKPSVPGPGTRDAGPFDEFWKKNVRRLAGYLHACSDGDDRFTDDATQDTMVILERRWERKLRYSPDPPIFYALKTGRRILRRYLRRDSRCTPLEDHGADRIPAAGLLPEGWVAEHADVLALLRTLPEKQREAVVLHVMFGYTQRETAKIMRVMPGSVKTHITRAMEALQTKHGRVQ